MIMILAPNICHQRHDCVLQFEKYENTNCLRNPIRPTLDQNLSPDAWGTPYFAPWVGIAEEAMPLLPIGWAVSSRDNPLAESLCKMNFIKAAVINLFMARFLTIGSATDRNKSSQRTSS